MFVTSIASKPSGEDGCVVTIQRMLDGRCIAEDDDPIEHGCRPDVENHLPPAPHQFGSRSFPLPAEAHVHPLDCSTP